MNEIENETQNETESEEEEQGLSVSDMLPSDEDFADALGI